MREKQSLDLSLYLVADEIHFRKGAIEDQIVAAVQGGVRVVQLREKFCSTEEFTRLAKRVIEALRPFDVPLIINDRVDVAAKVGAQGVHLGQSDLNVEAARRILGQKAIIGLSVESEEQVLLAYSLPVDYLGVSSVFRTNTKTDLKKVWGLDGLKRLRELTDAPLVGIGGIEATNLAQVVQAGADGIAIVSAFRAREDWKAKARLLLQEYQRAKPGERL